MVFQSLFAPGAYILVSRWAPRTESTTLLGIANMGAPLGTAIALPVCGLLAKGPFGWPSIYYFGTVVSLTWTAVFFIFGSQSPSESRFMSEAEKDYIIVNQNKTVAEKAPPVPWGKLFTSRAVIILFITEVCNGFGASVIQTEIPSYVHDVLDLPIQLNGIVSAMPWVCICTLLAPSSWLADFFVRRGILSKTVSKKVYTVIGLGMNGALLILCGIVGDNLTLAIVLICMATACATFTISGFHSTHLDIAPNFAGVLAALTSLGGHISGVIAPLTVGVIVKNNTVGEWTWVFIETGSVLIVGCIIYVLFGSTDLQSWNNLEEEEDENDKRNEIRIEA
ncbi:hypothetical protein GE061_004474 [Apolygus lucorum]|uniref:Major facilitator superfamily (MFS) profile domain-containing protein n=1 Tax=Apolygus lucorum TaxID=248454 RepID=A0A8S9WZE0_APOLU|nr:hypothetical protein GE061_004474 [Apolygus lucorum]